MLGGVPNRTPTYLRQAPRLPADLLRLPTRCDGEHAQTLDCCYYAALRAGGYAEDTAEAEVVALDDLKKRLSPPRTPKELPALEREADADQGGFLATMLRRRRSQALDRERLVDRDHADEPPPEGDYVVINGERIPI